MFSQMEKENASRKEKETELRKRKAEASEAAEAALKKRQASEQRRGACEAKANELARIEKEWDDAEAAAEALLS